MPTRSGAAPTPRAPSPPRPAPSRAKAPKGTLPPEALSAGLWVAALAVAIVLLVTLPTPATRANSSPNVAVISKPGSAASCSPGPYCGGGHDNLRAPWTPYALEPNRAADGLPFGAVGPVGPQGTTGARAVSRGVSSGTALCAVAGCATYVNSNTLWGNETLTVHGNVTIHDGARLMVYDSNISFAEPAASAGYSYGFTVNASTSDPGSLEFVAGSNLSGGTGSQMAPYVRVGFFPNALSSLFNDSWLYLASNHTGPASGLALSTFNYSTFNGAGNYGPGIDLGAQDHSWLGNGTVSAQGSNDTYFRDQLAFAAIARRATIVNDNVSGDGPSAWWYVSSTLTTYLSINRTIFYADNVTTVGSNPSGGILEVGSLGTEVLENDSLVRDFSGTNAAAGSFNTAARFLLGGYGNVHLSVTHVSLLDWSSLGWTGVTALAFNSDGITARYNLVAGFFANGSAAATSQSTAFSFVGNGVNVTDNLFENFRTTFSAGKHSTWSPSANPQVSTVHLLPSAPGGASVYANFFVGYSGQAWGANLLGRYASAVGNVGWNFNNSALVAVSVNSGSNLSRAVGNTLYGAFNGSVVAGSIQGGALGSYYSANRGFDLDTTSYDLMTYTSSETWNDEVGAGIFLGGNNSAWNGSGANIRYYPYRTTDVTLENSTLDDLTLWSFAVPGYYDFRSPPDLILPNDFNFTVDESYVPGNLTQMALAFSERSGPDAYLNPSFLNFTGYLGVFGQQWYAVNTSSIRGGGDLGIDYDGLQVASVTSALGHHLYAFEALSGSQYVVSADSTDAPAVPVTFNGLVPTAEYNVTGSYSATGAAFSTWDVVANATGSATVFWSPASDPLNSTLTITCAAGCPSAEASPAPGTFLGIPWELWAGAAAVVVAVGVGVELWRRHR